MIEITFYLLPECVTRTLAESQKNHFRSTGILPKSCHQAYVSACKAEGIQIHPKFQTTTKSINLEEKTSQTQCKHWAHH